MGYVEAIILGIVQGLTEFLPVSSSGHLELGKVLLGDNRPTQGKHAIYGGRSFRDCA